MAAQGVEMSIATGYLQDVLDRPVRMTTFIPMIKEFEKECQSDLGKCSSAEGSADVSKTSHGGYDTIYGASLQHTPKTIHSEAPTKSGGFRAKRGRGAPVGNLNALKTGRHTAGARRVRKQIWQFTSQVDALVHAAEAIYGFKISSNRRRKQNWPVMPDQLRRIYREKARKK